MYTYYVGLRAGEGGKYKNLKKKNPRKLVAFYNPSV